MNTKSNPENSTQLPAVLAETEVPAGIDRRSFIIRNAVIGAAAVMTGKAWTPEARAAQAAKEAASAKTGFQTLARPGRREEDPKAR